MSNPATNKARKRRVDYINGLIANGDPRSFNAIDAQLELVNWSENSKPLPMGSPRINNNRKRTNGRKIQVIPIKNSSKQLRTNI